MYEEYVSFRVFLDFFLSPEGAAVFLPASFFSAGPFAGPLPPTWGFFSAVFGGILADLSDSENRRRFTKQDGAVSGLRTMDVAAWGMCGWKGDEGAKEEKAGVDELYSRRRIFR
jgi:hypothetical protein